jgi:hypothetical protein
MQDIIGYLFIYLLIFSCAGVMFSIIAILKNRNPDNDNYGNKFIPGFLLFYLFDDKSLNAKGNKYKYLLLFFLCVLVVLLGLMAWL